VATEVDLRVVLIQVRERPDVAEQEQACILERCALAPKCLRSINVVKTPRIGWGDVADADVVLVGGAGLFSAAEDHPFTEPLAAVVRRWSSEGRPMFGACWGHQFMARVLGGEIVHDPSSGEVGTHDVLLTAEGVEDPLLAGFPERFTAHMGHNDRVTRLPPDAIELAYSDRCRFQMFRLRGKPIYGTQFHSELSTERLIERLTIYQDEYLPEPGALDALKRRTRPTPQTDRMLGRFMELVRTWKTGREASG